MSKPNRICGLTSLCLAKLVMCMFLKLMFNNTIESLKSMLLKFRLCWLTSREQRMKSSEGSHCLQNLSCISFKSPLLWKYISVGLGLHKIFRVTSYSRGKKTASIFLIANFTQHYYGCVRHEETKKEDRNQGHDFYLQGAYRAERRNHDSTKCFS